ncbi:MAG: hypothetical protein U1E27_12000, partial [Kiritimatiellia bacterium]|nr:hypothetical protein [Kiritimatiellia bacterium]
MNRTRTSVIVGGVALLASFAFSQESVDLEKLLGTLTAEPESKPAAEAPAAVVPDAVPAEAMPSNGTGNGNGNGKALNDLLSTPLPPEVEEAPAPTQEVLGEAQRMEQQERARREHEEIRGKKLLSEADELYRNKRYRSAAEKYNEAYRTFPDRPVNDGLRAIAQRKAAEAILDLAYAEYDRDDLKAAVEAADEAAELDPRLAKKVASLKNRIESRQNRIDKVSQAPVDPIDRPEIAGKRNQIDKLFEEGRRQFAIEEYDAAENRFESILLLDPYHRDSMRFLRQIEERRIAARNTHREATITRMVEEVRRRWAPPIRQDVRQPLPGETTKQEDGREKRMLRTKLESIVIPSIEFRQANIVDVINFLREASDAAASDGVGVNIILKLGGASATAAAPMAPAIDAWGTPSGTPAPDFSGGDTSSIPSITMNLRRVTLLDAIKYVTEVAGLRYRIEESAVIIVPEGADAESMITRIYPVEATIITVAADSSAAPADFTTPTGTGMRTTGTNLRRNEVQDFFVGLGIPFPAGSSISYNAAISQLIVVNTAENLEKLERILQQINVIPSQVEIEARFVEVNQRDLDEIGFQWLLTDNWQIGNKTGGGAGAGKERLQINANNTGSGNLGFTKGLRYFGTAEKNPLPTSRSASTEPSLLGGLLSLSGVLTNPEMTVVLHALEQRGGLDLLSAPRITTRSGNNAQIQVVEEILYPTEYEQQRVDMDVNVYRPPIPAQFESRGVGIILNATPTVGPDGYTIDLTLVPEVAELIGWIDYSP